MIEQSHSPQQYHKVKYLIYFMGLCIDFSLLSIFFFSGFSLELKNFSYQFHTNPLIAISIYVSVLLLSFQVIHFPLKFYSGYLWEHKFNLSNQNFGQWFFDELKKFVLGFIFTLIVVQGLYMILGSYPSQWWIIAGVVWLGVTFVLAKLVPNVIVPLFYKYTAIENETLKEKIFNLFKTCRVSLKDIYAIKLSEKTKKANAFMCGIGKNRRVVLSDTLLDQFTDSEIEVVVAHELGHYKHHDIVKLLLINTTLTFFGLFLVDRLLVELMIDHGIYTLDDIALFPLFVITLMIFSFLSMPIVNGFSRYVERKADRFSLVMTQKREDFVSLMEKLAKINLAEIQPNQFIEFMFYDHPSIGNRIKFANQCQLD